MSVGRIVRKPQVSMLAVAQPRFVRASPVQNGRMFEAFRRQFRFERLQVVKAEPSTIPLRIKPVESISQGKDEWGIGRVLVET